jgi:hypothetical protein
MALKEVSCEDVNWVHLNRDMVKLPAVYNSVLKLLIHKLEQLLASEGSLFSVVLGYFL